MYSTLLIIPIQHSTTAFSLTLLQGFFSWLSLSGTYTSRYTLTVHFPWQFNRLHRPITSQSINLHVCKSQQHQYNDLHGALQSKGLYLTIRRAANGCLLLPWTKVLTNHHKELCSLIPHSLHSFKCFWYDRYWVASAHQRFVQQWYNLAKKQQ